MAYIICNRNTFNVNSGMCVAMSSWLQVMEFENATLPPNFLVGNGGTKMIRNYIEQSSIPHLDLHINQQEFTITGKVKKGITLSQFGYSVMERNSSGSYQVNFHVWHKDSKKVKPLSYSVTINGKSDATKWSVIESQKFKQRSNILLVFFMLAGCWVTLWNWARVRRRRTDYSPIYEMEPVQSR